MLPLIQNIVNAWIIAALATLAAALVLYLAPMSRRNHIKEGLDGPSA